MKEFSETLLMMVMVPWDNELLLNQDEVMMLTRALGIVVQGDGEKWEPHVPSNWEMFGHWVWQHRPTMKHPRYYFREAVRWYSLPGRVRAAFIVQITAVMVLKFRLIEDDFVCIR